MRLLAQLSVVSIMLIILISIISYQGIYLDYQWDSPSIITFDTSHLDNSSQYNTNNLFFEFDTAAEVNSSLYLATTSWFLTSHYLSSQGFYIVKAKNPTFWTPVLNISSWYKTTTGYCCPNIMTNILTMSNNSQIFVSGNSTLGQLYSSRSSDGGNTWSTGQLLPLNISSFHTIDKSAIFSYNNTLWLYIIGITNSTNNLTLSFWEFNNSLTGLKQHLTLNFNIAQNEIFAGADVINHTILIDIWPNNDNNFTYLNLITTDFIENQTQRFLLTIPEGYRLSNINALSNKVYLFGICFGCKNSDTMAMGQLQYSPNSNEWSIKMLNTLIYQYSNPYEDNYFAFVKNTEQPLLIISDAPPYDIPGLFKYTGSYSIKTSFSILYDLLLLLLAFVPIPAVTLFSKIFKRTKL